MDYLFSPWRYQYVHQGRKEPGCPLCNALNAGNDAAHWILFRGQHSFILLNLFPYTSGHLMILPLEHVARLNDCGPAARTEIMELATYCEEVLQKEYEPDGLNVGINLGAAAGAGIAGHLHLHLVPRWQADANFMTVVGETRVLPEEISRTYERLRPYFPPRQALPPEQVAPAQTRQS